MSPHSLNPCHESLGRPQASCDERLADRYSVAVTAHPLATAAAIELFRLGGNAIDAAVAAAWALTVCEPGNSGLGGQSIMLLRLAQAGSAERLTVLDGHSHAPARACLTTVGRKQQHAGYRATTVPTTPMVLETARQRYGRASRAQVMQPAMRLAAEGFLVTPLHRCQLRWCQRSLRASRAASRLFLNNGQPFEVGQQFQQPELAGTLQRLCLDGINEFYTGRIARQISDDMRRHDGLLDLADLGAVQPPTERAPISTMYRHCHVVSVPPPAGGAQLLQGLDVLARVDLSSVPLSQWYELIGEATFAAFRTREQSSMLVDNELQRTLTEEPGETTHLCTADADGNVVSLTQSIQSLFGAKVACGSGGFLYNNYLTTCPRTAHRCQLVPGCQPRSNASPTLAFLPRDCMSQVDIAGDARPQPNRENHLHNTLTAGAILALGGAGSRRTTSAILHTISGLVDRGRSLLESVEAPRLHVLLNRKAWLERSPETELMAEGLGSRFRQVRLRARHSYKMGCVHALGLRSDGYMIGVADPRREGTVSIWNENGQNS